MRVEDRGGILVVVGEDAAERSMLGGFARPRAGHVFALRAGDGGLSLHDLGPADVACRAPLNVVFGRGDPALTPISNLARAPFTLDGRDYASVEGFWQGLRFEEEGERARVAALWGDDARRAARGRPRPDAVAYEGAVVPVGRHEHWALMRRACEAKFSQDAAARAALRATIGRPLTHVVARDSLTIPGVVMAAIWMAIRDRPPTSSGSTPTSA